MSKTYRYPPVKRFARRHGHCPVCGKAVARERTFTHYVSVFHPAVEPGMSWAEGYMAVVRAAEEEARDWTPDFTHEKCRETVATWPRALRDEEES